MMKTKIQRRDAIIGEGFRRPGEGERFIAVLDSFGAVEFTSALFIHRLKQKGSQERINEANLRERIALTLRDLHKGKLLAFRKRYGHRYYRNLFMKDQLQLDSAQALANMANG